MSTYLSPQSREYVRLSEKGLSVHKRDPHAKVKIGGDEDSFLVNRGFINTPAGHVSVKVTRANRPAGIKVHRVTEAWIDESMPYEEAEAHGAPRSDLGGAQTTTFNQDGVESYTACESTSNDVAPWFTGGLVGVEYGNHSCLTIDKPTCENLGKLSPKLFDQANQCTSFINQMDSIEETIKNTASHQENSRRNIKAIEEHFNKSTKKYTFTSFFGALDSAQEKANKIKKSEFKESLKVLNYIQSMAGLCQRYFNTFNTANSRKSAEVPQSPKATQ